MSCAEHRQAIAKCALFAGLTVEEQWNIYSIARLKHPKRHDAIFMEGEQATGLFLVATGSVRIYKVGADGREHNIRTVLSGGIFAEAAVFEGSTYPAYAESCESTVLLFIPRDRLLILLKNDPQISLKMMGTLSRRLRQMVGMIEDLSLKDVSARLAKYLLDATLRQKTYNIVLPMSKSALAQRLGTVPETLSRTFKKFAQQNIVAIEGKSITILTLDRLRNISAGIKE